MNLIDIIPADFAPDSRVWIYQSNRAFTDKETIEINEQLLNFYSQWMSHGAPVKGWGNCIYNQFIVVLADEDKTQVGGCSTDSMVRIIKSFERQYNVNLFDRIQINFLVNDKVQPLPMQQINYALSNSYIETDTPLFNNLVATKEELLNEWLVPLNKSWIWPRIIALQQSMEK
jgi:hypothetical protein